MPITVSYDLTNAGTNERNYIRAHSSVRLEAAGGSVFRYELEARKIG